MKKILPILLIGASLFPFVTFASGTFSQSALLAELIQLEAELASLLAQQPTAAQTAPTAPPVTVQASHSSISVNGGGSYTFKFQVSNNTGHIIYVSPTTNTNSTGVAGFVYSVQGSQSQNSILQSATLTCPTIATTTVPTLTNNGFNIYVPHTEPSCAVFPGKTGEVDATVNIASPVAGNYSVTFNSMNYSTTMTSIQKSPIQYESVPLSISTDPVYIPYVRSI